MPRSVQYPSLCFFLLLSTHSFFLLFPPFFIFSQVNCNIRKGSLQISLSLSRALSPSLSLNPSRWEEDEEEEVWAFSCCWLSPGTTGDGIWSTTVRLTPPFFFFFFRTDRTVPGLSAAVPPYRSAALCGTWGSSARCAPDQVSCAAAAAAESEAQKHRTHCLCAQRNPRIEH